MIPTYAKLLLPCFSSCFPGVGHTCPSRYPLLGGGFLRARPLSPWRVSSGGAGELEKTSPKARSKGGLSHAGAGATGATAGLGSFNVG